jgi:hypothetical protein
MQSKRNVSEPPQAAGYQTPPRMKAAVFFLLLAFAGLLPVYAGDALMPEERVLDITLPLRFSVAGQRWSGGFQWENASGPAVFGAGLELEYGVIPWLSAFAKWPGVNVVSQLEGESCGLFNDVILGLRGGILGPNAPLPALQKENMRLTAAFRFKAPLPSQSGSVGETDLHLWGTGLELSFDYIFSPLFYLNAGADFFYYPRQWADNPGLGGEGRIDLPLEMKFELEPHGTFALRNGFIVLSAGIPFSYQMSMESSFNGTPQGNDRHRFSVGASFGAAFKTAVPFDLELRYAAPVMGKNNFADHAVTLSGTVHLLLVPKKAGL